jgi:hypothetical protein
MQTQRTVDEALTPFEQASTPEWRLVAPQRSARRATARRASSRRATARQRKHDVHGLIVEYLPDHPHGTTGDIAKALNADRGTIAAGVAHLLRAREITPDRVVDWPSAQHPK